MLVMEIPPLGQDDTVGQVLRGRATLYIPPCGIMVGVVTVAPERIRLEIEGMTCASCAARIEKALNGLEGVDARVNLATEEATVAFDPSRLGVAEMIRAVESSATRGSPRSARSSGS